MSCPNPRRCLTPNHIHTAASSDPLVQAIREAIVEDWHEAGMYGRADFDPRWLDGLASVTAQAATNGVWSYLDNDPEEFCRRCLAGTESSEHFEKCGGGR